MLLKPWREVGKQNHNPHSWALAKSNKLARYWPRMWASICHNSETAWIRTIQEIEKISGCYMSISTKCTCRDGILNFNLDTSRDWRPLASILNYINHSFCIALQGTVLYCIVLYCIVLYCVVSCCVAVVLCCVVLCCVVLCCVVLCCVVLYCIVLFCFVKYR